MNTTIKVVKDIDPNQGVYVIGDVHGCYQTLKELLSKLNPSIPVVFVGDLIDRGPLSRKVIKLVKKTENYYCVKGNHEEMFEQEAMSPMLSMSSWYTQSGGKETLQSYTSPKHDEQLFEHIKWARNLPASIHFPELKDNKGKELVVSHASILNVWEKRDRIRESTFELYALWNRERPKKSKEIFNIFGHTPQRKKPLSAGSWSNIDTGCCYFPDRHYGRLSAIHFPSMEITMQDYADEDPRKKKKGY